MRTLPRGLALLPELLTRREHDCVLRDALKVLDRATSSAESRRVKKTFLRAHPELKTSVESDEHTGFLPDAAYAWQASHFDRVTSRFREAELSAPREAPNGGWPTLETYELVRRALDESLAKVGLDAPPHERTLTHLLHLASDGRISPHVDNREASGRIIVGISLGSERVVRFKRTPEATGEETQGAPEEFAIVLKPGSVYVQTEPLRSFYTHEIPSTAEHEGRLVGGQQRLSIMLRDKLDAPTASAPPA